ncbi:hypothetical protein M407DRAFT_10508 [Tulasnella calospora MUT 4182]|uniref:Uncharacterized protein n=1 Tax=Tulasnella calospora MUT 4182 TaxID=1051891 RepID=A0A0C3QAM3_9AGAM|nr:hypothetical protein M407DRAFT_10508 [Tulasnella calospora MUT 4182]
MPTQRTTGRSSKEESYLDSGAPLQFLGQPTSETPRSPSKPPSIDRRSNVTPRIRRAKPFWNKWRVGTTTGSKEHNNGQISTLNYEGSPMAPCARALRAAPTTLCPSALGEISDEPNRHGDEIKALYSNVEFEKSFYRYLHHDEPSGDRPFEACSSRALSGNDATSEQEMLFHPALFFTAHPPHNDNEIIEDDYPTWMRNLKSSAINRQKLVGELEEGNQATTPVPLSGVPNAVSPVHTPIHDAETVPPEITPIPPAQKSMVTAVFIEMPAPYASQLSIKGNSGRTSGGATLRADQRLADMFLGVHDVLGV